MTPRLLVRPASWIGTAALAATLLTTPDVRAVTPADSGRVLSWGSLIAPAPAIPAELDGSAVTQVVAAPNDAAFVTAAGRLVVQASNEQSVPPTELTNTIVRSVAQAGSSWAAVSSAGTVTFWGYPGPNTIPSAPLTEIADVALGMSHGVAIKTDGSVVAWGDNTYGQTNIPPGLSNVTKVVAGTDHTYALRSDGTVVGWGRNQANQVSALPAAFTVPGTVTDIAARSRGGLALLTNGTLASWGEAASGTSVNAIPATLSGKTITHIAAGSTSVNAAIATDGSITTWGAAAVHPSLIPESLDGRTVSQIAVNAGVAFAIQRATLTITPSTVSGTAKQGATLTGTPATFSGAPTITYQWLANGVPLAGATGTTLALTASLVGKRITFRTRAVDGSTTLDSDSLQTAAVAALPPTRVASKTSIKKPKVKRTKATISVKVTRSGGTPTGKVIIQVKRGVKKVYKKAVTLKRGTAQVSIKRLKRGKYKVSASYAGDSRSKASTARTQSFRVR